jgi:hypothetical protein
MKRLGFIIIAALVLLAGATLLLLEFGLAQKAPRFVAGRTQPTGNFTGMQYDWRSARPFEGDKIFVSAFNGTGHVRCLYDLRGRVILGELQDGWIEIGKYDGDVSKLLVSQRGSPAADLKEKFADFTQRIPGGRFHMSINTTTLSYWVLNLKNNARKRIGTISQYNGTSSSWYWSPALRYGCTAPTTENGKAFVLFDFQKETFTRIRQSGWLYGWWDEQNIVISEDNGNFALYDVVKRQTAVLFDAEAIQRAMEQFKLPGSSTNVSAFANWNGRTYDFYFRGDYGQRMERSFLLKAERTLPTPTLKLFLPEFKFEAFGCFDARATHYQYGSLEKGNYGAVCLRDLSDNATRILVPGAKEITAGWSPHRFYNSEIIYSRDGVLWRIGLDGSNNVPLFANPNGSVGSASATKASP